MIRKVPEQFFRTRRSARKRIADACSRITAAPAMRSAAWTLLTSSLVALVAVAAGCASGTRSFRAPGPGIPTGTTIAFLQLRNLTENEAASRIFEDKLVVELGRLGLFRVQDPGIVLGSLRKLRILTPDRMSADQMAALAASTGATYFLSGTVSICDPGLGSPRQVPSAAVSLWITDAASGRVVWAASLARTGSDSETLFGLGRIRNLDQLASGMAQDLAEQMIDLTEPGPTLLVRKETEEAER
jgi:hypothetical protein